MTVVVATGSFDDLRSPQIRFLEEASNLGSLHVLLWSDEVVAALTGKPPTFPQEERLYLLRAIRYVEKVALVTGPLDPDALPQVKSLRPGVWAVDEAGDNDLKRAYCQTHGLTYRVFAARDLAGFPEPGCTSDQPSSRKKVIVTGCYDWFHSGHVRFFEEVSHLGDLYVVVGHDENVQLLKGEGHPMFAEDERRYVVGSVRYVKQALVSTGHGWMDAEPEVEQIKPDIYAVNEDGDKPEKRTFCQEHGLEYVVLKRTPKEGLPKRVSTDLRGF
jgi:cytidyltransferase-like protein